MSDRGNAAEYAIAGGSLLGASAAINGLVNYDRKRQKMDGPVRAAMKRKFTRRHAVQLGAKFGARTAFLVGAPLAAYGGYRAVFPEGPVPRLEVKRDLIKPLGRQSSGGIRSYVDQQEGRFVKFDLTNQETKRLISRKKRGQNLSIAGGLMGVTALSLRAPEATKFIARKLGRHSKFYHNKGVKALTSREPAATKASNALGVTSIGLGSIGAFNYSAQQKLESRYFKKSIFFEGGYRFRKISERRARKRAQRENENVSKGKARFIPLDTRNRKLSRRERHDRYWKRPGPAARLKQQVPPDAKMLPIVSKNLYHGMVKGIGRVRVVDRPRPGYVNVYDSRDIKRFMPESRVIPIKKPKSKKLTPVVVDKPGPQQMEMDFGKGAISAGRKLQREAEIFLLERKQVVKARNPYRGFKRLTYRQNQDSAVRQTMGDNSMMILDGKTVTGPEKGLASQAMDRAHGRSGYRGVSVHSGVPGARTPLSQTTRGRLFGRHRAYMVNDAGAAVSLKRSADRPNWTSVTERKKLREIPGTYIAGAGGLAAVGGVGEAARRRHKGTGVEKSLYDGIVRAARDKELRQAKVRRRHSYDNLALSVAGVSAATVPTAFSLYNIGAKGIQNRPKVQEKFPLLQRVKPFKSPIPKSKIMSGRLKLLGLATIIPGPAGRIAGNPFVIGGVSAAIGGPLVYRNYREYKSAKNDLKNLKKKRRGEAQAIKKGLPSIARGIKYREVTDHDAGNYLKRKMTLHDEGRDNAARFSEVKNGYQMSGRRTQRWSGGFKRKRRVKIVATPLETGPKREWGGASIMPPKVFPRKVSRMDSKYSDGNRVVAYMEEGKPLHSINSKIGKADDRFLRQYGDRISPSAEEGYKYLKRGRNARLVDTGISAGFAGLSGGLGAHWLRRGSKGWAAVGGAGAALSGVSAVRSGRDAARWNSKMGKIKAKGVERAAAGVYGRQHVVAKYDRRKVAGATQAAAGGIALGAGFGAATANPAAINARAAVGFTTGRNSQSSKDMQNGGVRYKMPVARWKRIASRLHASKTQVAITTALAAGGGLASVQLNRKFDLFPVRSVYGAPVSKAFGIPSGRLVPKKWPLRRKMYVRKPVIKRSYINTSLSGKKFSVRGSLR